MNKRNSKPQRHNGQVFVELFAGLLMIIPIGLVLIDAGTMMAGNLTNVDVCKRAARAAASVLNNQGQADGQTAFGAATKVTADFGTSPTIPEVVVTYFDWEPNNPGGSFTRGANPGGASPLPGQVTVITTMNIIPPVPFPGVPKSFQATAQSIQPIVGLPPVAQPAS